jgi:hypothetical protein
MLNSIIKGVKDLSNPLSGEYAMKEEITYSEPVTAN